MSWQDDAIIDCDLADRLYQISDHDYREIKGLKKEKQK